MKNDKLIPGLVLVLIGAAILLANYGYLNFHWSNFWRFWPIFLVIGGVNLILSHNRSPWATILKIAVVVFGVGLLLFGNFGDRYNFWPGRHFSWRSYDNDNDANNNSKDDDDDNNSDDDDNQGTVKYAVNGTFNEPYTADVKLARLDISGAATIYELSDTTNQLFNASTTNKTNIYTFSTSKEDSLNTIHFELKDHHGNFDSNKDRATIRLNPNPVWQINVDAGATKLDFDLSKFRIRDLKLNGAAGSFTIKLGNPLTETHIELSNAASGVNLSIPESAACSVETDSFLSGNDFDGFTKTNDDKYITPGFNSAKNKFIIHVSSLVSGLHIRRY